MIGDFRKDNWAALKAANRDFVLIARALDLVSGELVAIDGAFFHGDASKASIATRKRLERELAALERDIEAYGETLEANDAEEEARKPAGEKRDGVAQKLAALMEKCARAKADLSCLQASGETQMSRTDADARLLTKNGQTMAFLVRGFNKVRGEWSLMALCYNFTRVLNILGFDGFIDYLARRAAARAILRLPCTAARAILRLPIAAAMRRSGLILVPLRAVIRKIYPIASIRFNLAT